MKSRSQSISKLISGIIILIMILVTAYFLYITIGNLTSLSSSQSSEQVKIMKDHNDDKLLGDLRKSYQQPDSIINTPKGSITITRVVKYQEFTYVTPEYTLTLLFIETIYLFFIYFILFTIYKVFKSASSGNVFVSENVKRLQKISWFLLGYVVFLILDGLFRNTIFTNLFNSSISKPIIEIDLRMVFPILFLYLLVLGVSKLFLIGVKVKEENDLTI